MANTSLIVGLIVLGVIIITIAILVITKWSGASPNGSYAWSGNESGTSSTQSSGGASGGSGS